VAKVTKRDQFVAILAVLEGLDEGDKAEFISKQIALLDKRAGAERGETKTQAENVEFKALIVGMLEGVDEGTTATDIATGLDLSVQRVSQLLRQLVLSGEVTRTDAKGKTKATFAVTGE